LTNENSIQEEIKCKFKAFSLFCLLDSHIRIIKIKIYKTIILPVVLYDYEKWFLTFWEERRLIRVFFKNHLLPIYTSIMNSNGL
jgi:hypothetical protein